MDHDWVLTVDLCESRMRSAAIGPTGKVLHRTALWTVSGGIDDLVDELEAQHDQLRAEMGTAPIGAGLAAPGTVEPGTGRLYAPAWPALSGLNLASAVQEVVGRDDVVVLRRANAALLGEINHGAGRGAGEALYLCLSSVVGGAIFSRGWLMFGLWGGAGELGHLVVDPAGPQCRCGRSGCLEAMASGPAIAAAAVEAAQRHGDNKLARVLEERSELTPAAVVAAAAAGDAVATGVLDAAGRAVTEAIVDLVNLFDPERIIVGGTVGVANPRWLSDASAAVAARGLEPARRTVAVVPAHLGEDAAALGLADAVRLVV
jgi:glucokinase